MFEKKSCIYEIYRLMGVVGKYTGCFPLPGVYEKKKWSKWTKGLINYVIPTLNCVYLLLFFFLLCFNYKLNRNHDLTDMLQVIFDGCIFVHLSMCIALNHLSIRRKLKSYLQLLASVDDLLQCQQRQLKRFVNSFSVLFVLFQAFYICMFANKYFRETFIQNFYENPFRMFISTWSRLLAFCILSMAIHSHPELMYIVFQRVLKRSFDELCNKIKKNRSENLNCAMRVQKIRRYMRLYGDLCQLSTRLDEMVSPLMLIVFVAYYMKEIHSLTYLLFISTLNMFSLGNAIAVVSGIVPLIFVSNSAYLTKKSHDEILSAIYSTFDSGDKAVKTELQNFALQSLYFNKSFSVSGFVTLDRNLIIATFQSLISQVAVFYKIHLGNAKKLQ